MYKLINYSFWEIISLVYKNVVNTQNLEINDNKNLWKKNLEIL